MTKGEKWLYMALGAYILSTIMMLAVIIIKAVS
jgi:hypothetical protein